MGTRYSAQPSALCGPPLSVQIHWMKSEESKFQVLIDVVLVPNRKLGMPLWGVNICLKGFEKMNNNHQFQDKETMTTPQARWNPSVSFYTSLNFDSVCVRSVDLSGVYQSFIQWIQHDI